MKKMFVIISVSILAAGVVGAVGVSKTDAALVIKHPFPAQLYHESPKPTLTANKTKPISQFMTKENLLKELTLPQGARILSATMQPWGQYVHEELHDDMTNHEIDKDRMVWVLHLQFANGVQTKGGFYENATQTCIYDAETGRSIGAVTKGKRTTGHISPYVPVPERK